MPAKIKIEFCTSCGSNEIEVNGQQFYCQICDVTYKVTEAGTKVLITNPLGKQNTRLDKVEKDVADLQGKKPTEQETPAPDPEKKDNEEDEGEQDGFVNW